MHDLFIKQTSAGIQMKLDDFQIKWLLDYKITGKEKGTAELDIKLLVKISEIGTDPCGNERKENE